LYAAMPPVIPSTILDNGMESNATTACVDATVQILHCPRPTRGAAGQRTRAGLEDRPGPREPVRVQITMEPL
jgi:hypothetical protein